MMSQKDLQNLQLSLMLQLWFDRKQKRISNTYGPNMQIDDGSAVTNFIYQSLNNKNITIYGDGNQTRNISILKIHWMVF